MSNRLTAATVVEKKRRPRRDGCLILWTKAEGAASGVPVALVASVDSTGSESMVMKIESAQS